jgi:hypothetical protein
MLDNLNFMVYFKLILVVLYRDGQFIGHKNKV